MFMNSYMHTWVDISVIPNCMSAKHTLLFSAYVYIHTHTPVYIWYILHLKYICIASARTCAPCVQYIYTHSTIVLVMHEYTCVRIYIDKYTIHTIFQIYSTSSVLPYIFLHIFSTYVNIWYSCSSWMNVWICMTNKYVCKYWTHKYLYIYIIIHIRCGPVAHRKTRRAQQLATKKAGDTYKQGYVVAYW